MHKEALYHQKICFNSKIKLKNFWIRHGQGKDINDIVKQNLSVRDT